MNNILIESLLLAPTFWLLFVRSTKREREKYVGIKKERKWEVCEKKKLPQIKVIECTTYE